MGILLAAFIIQKQPPQYEDIAPTEIPGYYHEGMLHTSWTINLKDDHNFDLHTSSCLSRSQTKGTWTLQGGVIVLAAADSENKDTDRIGERYVPIRFNHHLYIVAENTVPAFADDARLGMRNAPIFSRYPIKYDQKDPEFELISSDKATWFPPQYRPYFELGPIRAKVLKMVKDHRVEIEVTASSPVLPMMRLGQDGPQQMELQIESVTGTTAIAKVWYYKHSDRRVEVGDVFSSTGHVYPDSLKRYTKPVNLRKP